MVCSGDNPEGPEEAEVTDFGLPRTYDGSVQPFHIFFVRSAADISDINWPSMGEHGGLHWAIQPLISRREAEKRVNQQTAVQ